MLFLQDSPLSPAHATLDFQPGDTLFISPRSALMTRGIAAEIIAPDVAALPACARSLMDQARSMGCWNAIMMGAIPFSRTSPARVFIPENQRFMPTSTAAHASDRRQKATTCMGVSMNPTPARYCQLVADAVQAIEQGEFEKVVLSRSLTIEAELNLSKVLQTLARRNPQGYTFAVDLATEGKGYRTLVGSSPELLLSRRGHQVISNPLAGSLPRSLNPAENLRRSQRLLASAKDRHEHALVVNSVADALRPFCRHLYVPDTPSVLATPSMLHLSTEIRGDLIDLNTSSLEIALALHPTPAVCGHATSSARQFIEQHEGFDRGLFTGLVGWCNLDGDGEWAVTIRCAEVGDRFATLYAGAGIVAGSDPELELAETTAKLRTMLGAMELDRVLGPTA